MKEPKQFVVGETGLLAEFSTSDLYEMEVTSVPRSYKVKWQDALAPVEAIDRVFSDDPGNVILVDANVYQLYLTSRIKHSEKCILIEATEKIKTIETAISIIDKLEMIGFNKGHTLVVVGGGIVQDLAAFVGACYKRGINWHYFPTTLLSMCDSCIGGKTGLNHNRVKNQIALFSAPKAIEICPEFLTTLQDDDLASGLGEIAKLHLIAGGDFLQGLPLSIVDGLSRDYSVLGNLILRSLSIKRAVIELDEFEMNERRILNYGHTFGHALESLSNYRIPHGRAVAVGMALVNKIAFEEGMLDEDFLNTMDEVLRPLVDVPGLEGTELAGILNLVAKDKKAKGRNISLAVIKGNSRSGFLQLGLDERLQRSVERAYEGLIG